MLRIDFGEKMSVELKQWSLKDLLWRVGIEERFEFPLVSRTGFGLGAGNGGFEVKILYSNQ